ncbi:porphobilinogen deaminase [Ascobolus immersus RN42]|uniref:Porphobilinogen deaminase n=1 Tax=Ascobolus immersus RN42 TaxID=1160509 RepID=A0A3N4HJH5_ASCIM|nr:porphobilinogen deaminase [Ascobolus immersus RN42]
MSTVEALLHQIYNYIITHVGLYPEPLLPYDPSAVAHSTPTNPLKKRVKINIGTRKSLLALAQADIVKEQLEQMFPELEIEIHAMATMGDKNQVTPLHSFGAKSLWTHELEHGLVEGSLDLIVHSLKDMPTQLPETCSLGAILAREDPRDGVVFPPFSQYDHISQLPAGSVVGTSSVRRSAQLARAFPQLEFASVRGNVGTRLSKLDTPAEGAQKYACIILAAAGLNRLGLGNRITHYLEAPEVLYAVGQGALGIEVRKDDEQTRKFVEALSHIPTKLACLAERSLLRTLEGGCSVPIGVTTKWINEETLQLNAVVVSLDGTRAVDAVQLANVTTEAEAEKLGSDVAGKLREGGADEILEEIQGKKVEQTDEALPGGDGGAVEGMPAPVSIATDAEGFKKDGEETPERRIDESFLVVNESHY